MLTTFHRFMTKAYLSIGFQSRQSLAVEIQTIRTILAEKQISLFVFVDNYQFTAATEKQMMQTAFTEISSCNLLIAEVSEKAIGVGIEIGYAVALHKPVIYLRKANTEHSTTASGSADYSIVYENKEQLAQKLSEVMTRF